MWIGVGVVQGRPVELVRTPCCPRPLEQIARPPILDDETNKVPAEHTIRAAAYDVDIVRWRRISLSGLLRQPADYHVFGPLVLKPTSQYSTAVNTLDVVRPVVQSQYLDEFSVRPQWERLAGGIDEVPPLRRRLVMIFHTVDVGLQATETGVNDVLESRRQADIFET